MTWPGVAGAEMDPSYAYQGHFNLLNKYKKANPGVRVLVSVGGWAETGGFFDDNGARQSNGGFYAMCADQKKIDTFAASAVAFVRKYGFDGVDIDYEYPTSNQGAANPLDQTVRSNNLPALFGQYRNCLSTLRQSLYKASAQDNKYYLLTIAAPDSGWLMRGMEVFQVGEYLDFINIMSYDLHGAWDGKVAAHAALYDNNNDPDTAIYGQGLGSLNADWGAHYFRGQVAAGRINIGVPYYTRGWCQVQGGNNGYGGTANGPTTGWTTCPPGTTQCGAGAIGIDNIWHDVGDDGREIPSGANPMWHAKNLEKGIAGSYLKQWNISNAIVGTYKRFYDSNIVAPWLWNSQKSVFLSTEDEDSITTKAQYVTKMGFGGLMIWELAGDYDYNPSTKQYFVGNTLTNIMASAFAKAPAYGNTKQGSGIQYENAVGVLPITITYKCADSEPYPHMVTVTFTNNGNKPLTISDWRFDFSTSIDTRKAGPVTQGSGQITVLTGTTQTVKGLQPDILRAKYVLPTSTIPAGGSVVGNYGGGSLAISQMSNVRVLVDGQWYAIANDYPKGFNGSMGVVPPPPGGPVGAAPCSASSYDAKKVYNGGDQVTYNGRTWTAKWWTQGIAPAADGASAWTDNGACSAGSKPTATTTSAAPAATKGGMWQVVPIKPRDGGWQEFTIEEAPPCNATNNNAWTCTPTRAIMNKLGIEDVVKVVVEAIAKSKRFSSLTQPELLDLWKDLVKYIDAVVASKRTVNFHGFGSFHVKRVTKASGEETGICMPLFIPSRAWEKVPGFRVKRTTSTANGAKAAEPMNYSAISAQSSNGFSRETVEAGLKDLVHGLVKILRRGMRVVLPFGPMGRMYFQNGEIRLIFAHDYIRSISEESSQSEPKAENGEDGWDDGAATPAKREDTPSGDTKTDSEGDGKKSVDLPPLTSDKGQVCRQREIPVIQVAEERARQEKEHDRLLLHLSLEMDQDFMRRTKEMEAAKVKNAIITAQCNHQKAMEKEAREARRRRDELGVPVGNIFANRDPGPDRGLQGRKLAEGLQEQIAAKQIRKVASRLQSEHEDKLLNQKLVREVTAAEIEAHLDKLRKRKEQQEALAEQIKTQNERKGFVVPVGGGAGNGSGASADPQQNEPPFARSESLMFLYQKEKAKQLYQEQLAIVRQKREYEARLLDLERKHSLEKLALSRHELEKDLVNMKRAKFQERKSLENFWKAQIALKNKLRVAAQY
ncbi:hypothetical protein HK104_008639 [Borealophlyctis nickersoniae]|nr:hypothetical protein HK104_008639 [Borealophlyctis nickersoniae]